MSLITPTAKVNKFTKYLTKATGIAALGVIGYDSHIVGKLQSDVYAKNKDAKACLRTIDNTRYLTDPSMTVSNLKDGVNRMELDNNFRHFVNSGIGYFKGFGSMLISNVIPVGLGLGALFAKGKWAKGSAIGLGAYGVIKLFKDVLGLGHANDLTRKW